MFATYLIPESRTEALVKKVNFLAKRIKSGKTHASVIPCVRVVKDQMMVRSKGSSYAYPAKVDWNYSSDVVFTPYNWVSIRYEQPALNGWKLVSVYDWEHSPETGKTTCYTSTVPGETAPADLREVECGRCDHCKHNRRRVKAMLLRHVDTNEYKVVGSSCIKDFLGHLTPNSLVDFYNFEAFIDACAEEEEYVGGRSAPIYTPVLRLLEISSMVVRNFGYVKSGSWDDLPTVSRVSSWMFPYSKDDHRFVKDYKPTAEDTATAEGAIAWCLEQDAVNNEYMDTLQKAINAVAITGKRWGVVVSLITVYNRAMNKAKADAARVEETKSHDNAKIGAPKDKLKDIVGKVANVRLTEGYYGSTTIFTILSEEGNTFVWFASGNLEGDVEVGTQIKFSATLKKHTEFRGVNQNVVTRLKYVEV